MLPKQIQRIIVISHNKGVKDNNLNTDKVGYTLNNPSISETTNQNNIPIYNDQEAKGFTIA